MMQLKKEEAEVTEANTEDLPVLITQDEKKLATQMVQRNQMTPTPDKMTDKQIHERKDRYGVLIQKRKKIKEEDLVSADGEEILPKDQTMD